MGIVSLANLSSFSVLILFAVQLCYLPAVQAKLGSSIETFKQRLASTFKLVNQETKNQKTYYHFSLVPDKKVEDSAPGFGAGLTITTEGGKIAGESLLVRVGSSYDDTGKKLAAILCLNLAYDALDKPIPKEGKDQDAEFNAYLRAVSDALLNKPGRISYPGYSGQLIFSQTNDGNLLFVISKMQTHH